MIRCDHLNPFVFTGIESFRTLGVEVVPVTAEFCMVFEVNGNTSVSKEIDRKPVIV